MFRCEDGTHGPVWSLRTANHGIAHRGRDSVQQGGRGLVPNWSLLLLSLSPRVLFVQAAFVASVYDSHVETQLRDFI